VLVLQRQVSRPRFSEADRTIFAVLSEVIDRHRLAEVFVVVGPATVVGWHRRLVARHCPGRTCRAPCRLHASSSTSLPDILAAALQVIEAELRVTIGVAPGERSPDRVAQRNGHRPKLLSTPACGVEVGIPKLRQSSFFPELLEP